METTKIEYVQSLLSQRIGQTNIIIIVIIIYLPRSERRTSYIIA